VRQWAGSEPLRNADGKKNDYWDDQVGPKRESIRKLLSGTGIAKIVLTCAKRELKEGAGVLVDLSGQAVLLTPSVNLRNSDTGSCDGEFGHNPNIHLVVEFVRPDDTVVRFNQPVLVSVGAKDDLSVANQEYLKHFHEMISVLELPSSSNDVRERSPDNEVDPIVWTKNRLSLDRVAG
jgi:hypothetical protein